MEFAWKSMDPDGIHHRVIKELSDVIETSQLFFNRLGNLERTLLSGSWQTLPQVSVRARVKLLIITILSVSLQYLAKLWRLFWELLEKKYSERQCKHCLQEESPVYVIYIKVG